MKKIKLRESDLRKIVQRTINESQLLLEAEAICDRGAEACGVCRETLIKAGVGSAIQCICHGHNCPDDYVGKKSDNASDRLAEAYYQKRLRSKR